MTDKEEILEERNGIIVVGMISSGKSTFLNSLLGITYLETKDDITTKLVTIIRYNGSLEEPKFYHLKLKAKKKENLDDIQESTPTLKDENTSKTGEENNTINEEINLNENNIENYDFIKDGEEYIGEEKIIQKISNINTEEAKNKEPKYDNLFYMLETNITNIENKDFLNTHDFYDIPGLNEYILSSENKNIVQKDDTHINKKNETIEESKEDMRYIKGIFQYIKKKVEREIIVLNTETYYKPQNLQIIDEIKNYLNISLYDNLIILNKIDISNDRNKTIEDCKQFFVNNIESNIFNINNNVFVPLNSKQFKNELLMKNNYKYYYLYYLNKYIEKYVNIKEEDRAKIKVISFVEFIVKEITSNIKKKDKKEEYIKKMAEDFDDEKLKIIRDVYEEIKKKSNAMINYGINFKDNYDEFDDDDDDNKSIVYMKAFFKNFQEKKNMPEYSEDVVKILDYFNNFKDNSQNLEAPLPENRELSPEKKAINLLKDIFGKLKKYVKEDDEDNILNYCILI